MTSPLSDLALEELRPAIEAVADVMQGRSAAVSQEWIGSRAGSEKVFEALAMLFADAELFTLSHTPSVEIETGGRPITTSLLDRAALRDRRSLTLPLMPLAWRRMRREWDVVVSSTHALGRSFGALAGTHLSYVHSPARYIWYPDVDRRSATMLSHAIQAPARTVLKPLDRRSTALTDALAANSVTTQSRIREVYDRESTVIHPPCDTTFYTPPTIKASVERSGLLALGRLVPYKRMDSAIEVAHRLGLPLTVVGSGPDLSRLEILAASRGASVDFIGGASDVQVRDLYRTSQALLFPGLEDFGLVPVEAQACGCPVVTSGVGGALETVVDGVTGAHARSGQVEDLVEAALALLADPPETEACRRQAERFSYRQFGSSVAEWMASSLKAS